ncbi:hypothetical protein SS50377_26721 [Spironucleus salmonicida]|uniref:Uncharacterized protein n=1 Tax=Spironucleus salmonicida TaxID=348837 RepID=V6LX48_9EUKA|nr:hypothetical protein SS50377_26721 [Spironucleus salmonicida]|eukprot:EST49192.1 Hypothetical protein SS50377_10408 [Spironucleus salmonicida]
MKEEEVLQIIEQNNDLIKMNVQLTDQLQDAYIQINQLQMENDELEMTSSQLKTQLLDESEVQQKNELLAKELVTVQVENHFYKYLKRAEEIQEEFSQKSLIDQDNDIKATIEDLNEKWQAKNYVISE